MDKRITSLERAFELAKEGNCKTVDEIRKTLRSSGFNANQIEGKDLRRQLFALIKASRAKK